MMLAAKSASQMVLHMVVAFAVMYAVTGSLAFGGLAAVIEPAVNVLLLPLHDRLWQRIRRRLAQKRIAMPSSSPSELTRSTRLWAILKAPFALRRRCSTSAA